MWIYATNSYPVSEPHIDISFPSRPTLPQDFPDEAVLAMLEKAFPEKDGDERLRLEDHIRHHEKTLLCICSQKSSADILLKFQDVPEYLRIEKGKKCKTPDRDLLPSLCGGQWRICEGCPHFSRKDDHIGRCDKRWCCRMGCTRPREWDLDHALVPYHSQCERIMRHFRFETAYLYYTKHFTEEIQRKQDPGRFLSERKRLLRRDITSAVMGGDYRRIRECCAELGETLAEFAATHDVLTPMLSYWEVRRRLVDNVRVLTEEGIPIPQKWRGELLALSGEEHLRAELRQLLASFPSDGLPAR